MLNLISDVEEKHEKREKSVFVTKWLQPQGQRKKSSTSAAHSLCFNIVVFSRDLIPFCSVFV